MRPFEREYVQLNGVKHFLLHYENEGAEVLIYLHGGPGQATSNLAYRTEQGIRSHTTVHYDQRGAGKTLLRNWRSTAEVTMDVLMEDLRAVVAHVKDRYRKDKVALLGHSWGSLLGTEYIKRHPEDVLCYIGVGQIVCTALGERAGFEELRRRVPSPDRRAMATIRELEGYPDAPDAATWMKQMMRVRRLQGRYGIGADIKMLARTFVRSPIFTPLDLAALARATSVNRQLDEVDFAYDTRAFTDYQVPIYYVLGENDWQVPSTVASDYLDTVTAPAKGIYWIKGAGHVPNLENPTEFNEALARIFAEVGGLPPGTATSQLTA